MQFFFLARVIEFQQANLQKRMEKMGMYEFVMDYWIYAEIAAVGLMG